MTTNQAVKLTRDLIAHMLTQRDQQPGAYEGPERRQFPRWPVTGRVEMRPAGPHRNEHWVGDCHDISEGGLGLSCPHYVEPETLVDIVLELAGTSACARAVVRYCQQVRGRYMIGIEFNFD